MNGNEGAKNNSRVKAAYIVTAICLITAGILFYFLFTAIFADWRFKGDSGQGTRLEFNTDNPDEAGFNREMTIYTEDGITKAVFSGKITVDGTSEIIVAANEDGRIVYSGTYSDLKDESIKLEINDLEPYATTLSASAATMQIKAICCLPLMILWQNVPKYRSIPITRLRLVTDMAE